MLPPLIRKNPMQSRVEMLPTQTEEFVRLLGTAQTRVFAYIYSLVHNWNDADEIAQETNLVLWRKFSQFEAGTDFVGWACGVAYFEVLRFRRERPHKEIRLDDDLLETLAEETAGDLETFDSKQQAIALCLEQLPAADRQLVQLRDRFDPATRAEATTESVAQQVGRSVSAVYKALNRIRWRLLDCVRRQLSSGGSA